MPSGGQSPDGKVGLVSDQAKGPLDPDAVLHWMRTHPDRLRELLMEEDPVGEDDAPASDSAVRAHLRLAAEGMVHGADPDLAAALDGMADTLDEWFEQDRELFDHQIALGEGAIALEEHLLYKGDAEANPAIHDALERRVRLATWNRLFLRCIEQRLGPEHDGFADEALDWIAARGRDLATMIMQMDASQRAALELRLGRKPTRDEQVQSGQLAAVTAYVRMTIEAAAHVLEPPEAARPA
jgi:hypothetical protein